MNITILNTSLNQDELEQHLIAIIDSNNLHNINYVQGFTEGQSSYVKELAKELYKEISDANELLANTDILITFGDDDVTYSFINQAKSMHIKVISDIKESNGFKPVDDSIPVTQTKPRIILGTVWDKPTDCINIYIGKPDSRLPEHTDRYFGGRKSSCKYAFSNPFYPTYEREQAIDLFRTHLKHNRNLQLDLQYIYDIAYQENTDIKLHCWCKNKSCHGEVIKEYLESL